MDKTSDSWSLHYNDGGGGRGDNKMGQGELNMWNEMAVQEKYGDQKSPH